MPIAALIPIIAQYGIPLAQKLWAMITSGKDVTQADWDTLNALANETPQSHLMIVAQNLGLPMTDPRIVSLAELIK